MHACDIRQYLANPPKQFCSISPNITLANILSYMIHLASYIYICLPTIPTFKICQAITYNPAKHSYYTIPYSALISQFSLSYIYIASY